jgi:putative transposase
MTFKYRLSPTHSTRKKLENTLEQCRWVYNQTLALRKDAWEQAARHVSYFETKRMLPIWKAQRPALKEAHSQVLQKVTERVELAFQAFFRRVKAGEEKPGYPRFRGPGWYDSFTYTQTGFALHGDRLWLSKVGEVKVKLHRPLQGCVKTLTLQRDALNNWYACFSCEVEPESLPPTEKVVGVDLGLSTFAMLSNGEKIARQRWMKRDANDIARLQRKKEQFAKGSGERASVVRALNHAYQRAANRRRDFAHQQSRKLVNEYQFIAFENLDIQGMQQESSRRRSKTISRGIADVAWGQFVQFTTYKAASAGRGVTLVNPKGTTQNCSGCGAIVPKDLTVRVHDCPHCGLKMDRDRNAALNILARGLASLSTGLPVVAVEARAL